MLLWHGKQSAARTVVRPLAQLVAEQDVAVVAPDWDSHADDGGRAELLQSLRFTRGWIDQPDRLILVGWSLGGLAAAALTLRAAQFGARVAHTVCLAGAFMLADPFSGKPLCAEPPVDEHPTPFTLLHGSADDAVPVAASRGFAAALERSEWPVRLIELAADHGSIVGARYDPATDRYAPAEGPGTTAVAAEVAARIAAVAAMG